MTLEERLQPGKQFAAHIVVRGTVIPDTTRCMISLAIERYVILKTRPKVWDPNLWHITCFSDVRINDYLVGKGPAKLTLAMWFHPFMSYETASEEARAAITDQRRDIRAATATRFEGCEFILFLAPHGHISVEAWSGFRNYLHVTRTEGTIKIVSSAKDAFPQTPENLIHLEFGLEDFEAQVVALAQARNLRNGGRIGEDPRLPMLVTDANNLRSYYEATGSVYDDPAQAPVLPPALPGTANKEETG